MKLQHTFLFPVYYEITVNKGKYFYLHVSTLAVKEVLNQRFRLHFFKFSFNQEFISPICPPANNTIVGVDHIKAPFRGSIRAAVEAAAANERDRAPLFYTPGSMSGRAAGKLKQKKDGRPKNVLGAHFFPLLQMYLSHPFLLLINSLPPSLPRNPLNPQNSAFISLRPGRPLPYHRLSLRGRGGCRPLCLHLPLASPLSPLSSSQSCHISSTERLEPRVHRLSRARS